MKKIKNKLKIYHRGFTLIELMVVISIIALLSSIVLVALKDAREKAKTKAFRAEVNQFINALELYRTDNGKYPGEPLSTFSYYIYRDTSGNIDQDFSPVGYLNLQNALSKYISKIPVPPTTLADLKYLLDPVLRCQGDTKSSNYYLLIDSTQPGFEDWPFYTYSGILYTSYRCFSLK